MLAKKYRLPLGKTKKELRKVFSSPFFAVKAAANETHNRFGVIIPNSAVKKSARRHFWKRVFISNLEQWPDIRKDVLFIVSPNIEKAGKVKLKKETEKVLEFLLKIDN